ncbi:hypothetical protein [Rhodanobacter soli]
MRKTLGLLALLLVAPLARAGDAPPLPALTIDASRTAVVGLSSGAYMAAQVQLAYPELFPNAAIVAGGPFGCAGGKLDVALGSCMKGCRRLTSVRWWPVRPVVRHPARSAR